jgi:hypothetical protein
MRTLSVVEISMEEGATKTVIKERKKHNTCVFLNVIQNHFDPVFEKIISSNMSFVQYLEYSLSDGLDERRHQNVPEPNWSIDKEDSPVHRYIVKWNSRYGSGVDLD